MPKFTPTRRGNSCVICENSTGKCREHQDGEIFLCMSFADARLGEVQNGYKCIKPANGGNWATFKLDNTEEWTEQQRAEWQQKNQQRQQRRASEEKALRANALPIEARDLAIRKLHKHFGLSATHRNDLNNRGLSDEAIDRNLYFSITPNRKVPFGIPKNLPGVEFGEIRAGGAGYACVSFDPMGRATGWQIRIDKATENKYRWAKGEASSHLSNGELPITSSYPAELKRSHIGVCEGINKAAIAANRFGQIFLGASGANFAASPEQTAEHLRVASEHHSGSRLIHFYPDAGSINNQHVIKAYKRSLELIEQLGYEIQIAWWGQVDKSHPDIDELHDLSKIKFINLADFLTWAGKEETDKSASTELPQKAPIQNQRTSKGKLQKPKKSPLKTSIQELHLLPQSTTLGILNPPLVVASPIQSLKNSTLKVLPIPESVASCLTTEAKAPRQEQKWFEKVLKRVKKVFSKNAKKDKLPRLGFKCFKEDNPDFEEKIRQVQRKLRSLSYDADIETHQRYLPDEIINQLPKSGLIGIKAPKGCGKSVLLKKIITLAKQQGISVLSITPRIALGREQAIKWEITWIDDYGMMQTRAGDTSRQIAEVAKKMSEAREKLIDLEKISHQQLNLLDETETLNLEQQKADLRAEIEQYEQQIDNINSASINTLALCWDSLWRTKDRDLKEGLIVVDEAELGFEHFITGSTCRRNRPYLLKVFKDKLTECLMSGGRVILSDADLTDLAINYVREILPIPIKPFIVTNDYVGEKTKWMVDLRTGNRGGTLSEIIEAVHDGAYLAITTDSQAEAQALQELILKELPDDFCTFLDTDGKITDEAQARKKALIIRIDSTTTETEAGKAFIQKPNEQILHWKPRILIYTPSMGVGVSIDESTKRWDEEWQEMVPYFDAVYGLFFGVIVPSQCRQQLSRVRANIPRIVYCKESNKSLEGCSSFFPDEVKRQTLKYNHSALNILDIAKGIAGYEADDEEIREAMLQLLNDTWDKNSRCWKEPSIDLASAFKARANYGLWNLINLLREELEDEGHTIVSIEGEKTHLIKEMSQIKDSIKLQEATLIAEASTMPLEEAKEVRNKLGATKEQKLSAQKTLLQEELPEVNLTPEFVKKAVVDDRRRWLNQQRLFWYHSNIEAVKQIDTDHWLSNLKRFAEGTPFMRDMRSHAPKVDALRKSGVFEFVDVEDCDRIYQGDTPEAEAFVKQCLRNKDDLQTALNILVTKKSSPISLANRILSKIGLRLEKLTRSNKDNRWRLSADLINDPDRVNVLKAFELRWQMSQQEAEKKSTEKQAQTQSQQAIQTGGGSPCYIDQNIDRPPNFEGVSQGVIQLTVETAALQKSELEQLLEALPVAATLEDFARIVEGCSRETVENAIALSGGQPRRLQLLQWYESLKQASGRPALASYTPGDEVWAYFPQSRDGWLKGTIEWVRGKTIRVVSGFFGIFIEREDAIAPGDWVMSG